MLFMNWIVEKLADITDLFGDLYQWAFDLWSPFNLSADFFYWLYRTFYELTYNFSDFRDWVNFTTTQVMEILNWETIRNYISGWLRGIANPLFWFYNLWSDVWNEIETWWQAQKDELETWWNEQIKDLIALKAAWDNFWTVEWPKSINVNNLTEWWNSELQELQGIFGSTIKEWFPFYNSLASLWDSVAEFIADPLQWLTDKFDEWFERFW